MSAYDLQDDMMKVKSMQKKWKSDFAGIALDPNKWEVLQTGAGQTITVSAGELTIAAGTTANAETILLSQEIFQIPFRVLFGFFLSQKIINQEFYLEVVSCDPVTGAIDELNVASWRIAYADSTAVTSAVYRVGASGITPLNSAASTINTSASYNILEIEPFTDECWFHSRQMDSTNGRNNSYVRHQNIPNPNASYRVRIRVKNLGTAPASNTNFKMQFVNVADYAELTAEITAGRGNAVQGQAIAAQIVGTVPAVTTVTTAYVAPKIVHATETVANIPVATPFVGTAKDLTATPLYTTYRLRVFADQPLTIDVYAGTNATLTSNRIQQSQSVPANTMTIIDVPLAARYVGVKATNTGAATTTVVEILSALLASK